MRRHTDLSDPQTHQQWQEHGTRTHLPAHRYGNVVLASRLNHHPDQTQNGRITLPVKVGHPLIRPINRESVLNQVIGPKREKIDLAGKLFGHDGCGRDFNHHANRHLAPKRHPLLLKILDYIAQDHSSLSEFQQRRNEREHDPQIAELGRAQCGSQLRLEELQILQTQPDTANAQRRIDAVGVGRPQCPRHLV